MPKKGSAQPAPQYGLLDCCTRKQNDMNAIPAPAEKGPRKGFLQSIMDDVNNPPNRRERPKEIGFGPSLK